MKKLVVLLGAFALLSTVNVGLCAPTQPVKATPVKIEVAPNETVVKVDEKALRQEKINAKYDEMYAKLKLDEKQIAKARAIRASQEEKITPLFKQIMGKKQEINAVKRSRIAVAEQDKKIAQLKSEIKPLKKDIKAIRKDGKKEFMAILTPEQKVIYEQMKAERKAQYQESCDKNCSKDCPSKCKKENCPKDCTPKCGCKKDEAEKCTKKSDEKCEHKKLEDCKKGCPVK